jgi:hypothetical protein
MRGLKTSGVWYLFCTRGKPMLNKTYLFYSNSLLLYNDSVTSIDNTQLSLSMGYKRKVSLISLSSYPIIFNMQSYSYIPVLSLGSLYLSSHVHPTAGPKKKNIGTKKHFLSKVKRGTWALI